MKESEPLGAVPMRCGWRWKWSLGIISPVLLSSAANNSRHGRNIRSCLRARAGPVAWHTHNKGIADEINDPEALNMLEGCIAGGKSMATR